MKLYSIPTGNFKLDGGAMFGVVPKSLWEKQYPADEHNLCNWAMRCLLATDDERRILIDNGIGDKQDERFLSHYHLNGSDSLASSLHKAGFQQEDITDVFLTHLHFDHCGGSLKWNEDKTALVPAFPNARYWVSSDQWALAKNPNPRERASLLHENIFPMEDFGLLHFIEKEGELFPGFDVRFFHGHTESQAIPIIESQGKKVAFVADLMPSPVHMPVAWVLGYDVRPLITMTEKPAFLKEAVDNDYILFFEHDLNIEACTLTETPKGVRPAITGDLKDLLV